MLPEETLEEPTHSHSIYGKGTRNERDGDGFTITRFEKVPVGQGKKNISNGEAQPDDARCSLCRDAAFVFATCL